MIADILRKKESSNRPDLNMQEKRLRLCLIFECHALVSMNSTT